MSASIRFIFAVHDHQPVGNFDSVIEQATADAYVPFLDVVERYPAFRFGFHASGPLFEWWEAKRPDLVDRLALLVERGQMEPLGGGFYEPILPMLPERDRVGQIEAYADPLHERLGRPIEGMWLAERVWEPGLARSIADAGMRWTIVDDFHLMCAGVPKDKMAGYFVTEDDGRLLRIFPISEALRYRIPFAGPEETVALLRSLATEEGDRVVVYADDGEKFGVWPRTKRLVYGERWLERFVQAILAESSWLRMSSFSEVVRDLRPAGRVYLPDCSYREMTEWALPVESQVEYDAAVEGLKRDDRLDEVRRFLRGGNWRMFLAKYPEACVMYSKMRHVSDRLAAIDRRGKAWHEAVRSLYRGQCNCAYWHGVFGGLYLPHLRDAVYKNLLEAEAGLLASPRPVVERRDFDLDTEEEIHVTNGLLGIYVKPGMGGHIYELDVLEKRTNLLAGLARRPETYHAKVSGARVVTDVEEVASIHDLVLAKQEGLHRRLQYDPHWRMGLMDHFFRHGSTLEAFARGEVLEDGDFLLGRYSVGVNERSSGVQLNLSREGTVGGASVRLEKTIWLPKGEEQFEVTYAIRNLSDQDVQADFGVEWNFAMLAGKAHDRYLVDSAGRNVGPLSTQADFPKQDRFTLVDEWKGIRVSLSFDLPADVWTFPVETVSQSESGFELVYQSTSVTPRWVAFLQPHSTWKTRLTLAVEVR